jgi:hypothetical protein
MSSQATRLESWYIMHIQHNTMANSFNHCWKWTATKHFTHILEINVAVSVIIILNVEQQRFNSKLFERQQYNLLRSSRKSALYFIPSLTRFGFSRQITKKAPEFNTTEINILGPAMIHANSQKDMTKFIGASRKYMKEPEGLHPSTPPPPPLRQTVPQQMSFSERVGAIYSITYLSLHLPNSNILQSKTIIPSVLTLL